MDRIIRSNAVETSSQSESLKIKAQDVHPCYNQAPEMATVYGGSAASIGAALPELPTNFYTATATTSQAEITSTGKYSTPLQKVLEQRPSVLPYLVLLGSLAFFVTVVVWACTGKIEEISQVQGKFIPSGRLYQLQPQDFGKVKIAVKEGQKVKAGQLVAEIDTLVDDLKVKKQRLQQIKTLLYQTQPKAVTSVAMTATEEQTASGSIVSPQITLAAKQQLLTQLQTEITQLQTKITETKTLLNQAKAEVKPKSLYAPIDRVVSSSNISSTGEVIQPKQTLGEIAPIDAPLVLVTTLPSQKVGFVNKGDRVKIKLNADSGHLDVVETLPKDQTGQQDAHSNGNKDIFFGSVMSISPNVQHDEKLGWVYRVEVALNRNQAINFKAGQTATAQIIHNRRIADMFLEPIKELQKSESNL
ncbi:HlyD family efflux transporter periplasmic adaptor subunit [Fischerella sp. PCC 9605]|uniref:HlyD family efflux transporter periplasmic adaptor subunit n=1 Tax=Fischerella sp. PCC 9605 TaxID=1173024 RepID=UPI000685294B|nr:HlyD family efflux transporter periplasmic adaptor subunit [Fischerella sp. PCC 9605]